MYYKKCLFLLFLYTLQPSPCLAEERNDIAGEVICLNDNGAWCWFQDERVIVDRQRGRILVSSVANGAGDGGDTRAGDVDVACLEIATGQVSRFVLHAGLQADDHNTAALLLRPDGRYLAMFGSHGGIGKRESKLSRWRVSVSPGGFQNWTPEQTHEHHDWMTYSNLHYLRENISGKGRVYNFSRSNNYDPNVMISEDMGSTWHRAGKLLTEGGTGDRPYVIYASDSKTVHLVATERHPRDFDTSAYHAMVQKGSLLSLNSKILDDSLLDESASSTRDMLPILQAGTLVGGVEMHRVWPVDLEVDKSGSPVIVLQARADNNPNDHRFFYTRWDGNTWRVSQLAYAGGSLYSRESDYTGLAAIDPDDPATVYISTNVDPVTGTPLIGDDKQQHYEIFRGRTTDNGAKWKWTPITKGSKVDNLRPMVPAWDQQHTALLWFRGTYQTYQRYNTEVVGLIFETDKYREE